MRREDFFVRFCSSFRLFLVLALFFAALGRRCQVWASGGKRQRKGRVSGNASWSLMLWFCMGSGIVRAVPGSALLDSGSMGRIAVFRVAGIVGQHVAGDVRALAAVQEAFLLAALSHGAFPVERMAVCLNTAAAATGLLVFASGAV